MKKLLSSILVFTLLCFLPSIAHAQFGNILKKAKQKAKEKIEQKVNKKTNSNRNTQTSRTSKPYEEKQTPNQRETEVNTQEKNKTQQGNQANQIDDMKKEYDFINTLFLLDVRHSFILGSKPNEAPLRAYDRPLENPPYTLEDAIQSITDEEFAHDRTVQEIIEIVKKPEYVEERYKVIDYVYESEIEFREKYPTNTDRDHGNYEAVKDLYDLYKFIQKYIIKNDPEFDAQVVYAKKKMEKINAKFDGRFDDIAINDVHKANLYKIIFTSNSKINPQTAPASEYKTTFKPGEEIFAVAMVDRPLNKKIVKQAYAQVEMKNGADYVETVVEHQMFPIKPNQKYFVFPIVVKSNNFKCSNTEATANTEYGMRWLSGKEDRKFKINVWLKEGKDFHNTSGSLTGTFTFDASSGDSSVLRKMANQVAAKCGRE